MSRINIPVWAPAAAALAFRLYHLGDIHFINPDGATYIRYDLLVLTQRLPFYPILTHMVAGLGLNELIAAKLVAALCAAGAIACLSLFASDLGVTRRQAWLLSLLFAVDPLFMVDTLQPLTEGTFTLLALLATFFAFRFNSTNNWRHLFGFLLISGLSALTRAEGYIFAPLCVWGVIQFIRRGGKATDLCLSCSGFISWALILVWQVGIARRAGYLAEFETSVSRMAFDIFAEHTLLKLLAVALHLSILGLAPAIAGLVYLYRYQRDRIISPALFWLLLYLIVATWIGISIHWYADARFSTTIAAWLSLPGGLGLATWLSANRSSRRLTQALILALCIAGFFLGSIMVKETSAIGREFPKAAAVARNFNSRLPVLSNELAMISYHLGYLAYPFDPNTSFRRALVILRGPDKGMEMDKKVLERRFAVRVLEMIPAKKKGYGALVLFIQRKPETPATDP